MLYGQQLSKLTIRGWEKIVGQSDDNRQKFGGPVKFLINLVEVWVYTRSIIFPEVFVYTGAVIQLVGEYERQVRLTWLVQELIIELRETKEKLQRT